MSNATEVLLPDIGDFADVEIIELHVSVGDHINIDDSIVTLESDKATMDVPSTVNGTVASIQVAVGEHVSEGDLIITVTEEQENVSEKSNQQDSGSEATPSDSEIVQVHLPDIGDFQNVEIIELHVAVGTAISVDDSIITLESDKATMDVPCTVSGQVASILVGIGDRVSEGDVLIEVAETGEVPTPSAQLIDEDTEPIEVPATKTAPDTSSRSKSVGPSPPPTLPPPVERSKGAIPHASPSVRRFARRLGADLSQVRGTGPKGRIMQIDVEHHIKNQLTSTGTGERGAISGPPPISQVDFTKFGETKRLELSKIKRITGDRLHRAWLDIPHVTHHDEADITELESFRQKASAESTKSGGPKITMLAFITKAVVRALDEFPTFNASLSSDAQALILKQYCNIGVAVDTPNGLVVPVIRDVRALSVTDLAQIFAETSERARAGKLTPTDFEGGCFTISSLGGIGGRFFTPIINPPEVAILGVSRHHPVLVPSNWRDHESCLMLPLSLSYDHRVVDGAEAARFVAFLGSLLSQPLKLLL